MDQLNHQLSLTWIYDLYRLGQAGEGEAEHSIAHAILEHIASVFRADSGSLALADESARTLQIIAGIALPPGVVGSSVNYGDRILGWVAEHREALLLSGDIGNDPRFRHLSGRQGQALLVAMCWPLLLGGRLIGVISVNRKQGSEPFSTEDWARGGAVCSLVAIVLENVGLHREAARRIDDLTETNRKLETAQSQLLQSEKMASIGQLAAGVAHEINNPVGYVNSNLGTLQGYINDLFRLLDAYTRADATIAAQPALKAEIETLKQALDLGFLREDTLNLVTESQEGLTRVKKIVADLKEFSHVDRAEWQQTDLHLGIDSTLNIVNNEIKYKAEIVKDYGTLPAVECIPAQLNQVFMNLLVNAAQAIDARGTITIKTGTDHDGVYVEIRDTGKGMSPEVQKRIFEPFFTTKAVGKGTGLGLSLSYGIVQKHNGRIDVTSTPGQGTAFRVWVPIRRQEDKHFNEDMRAVGT
jgi:signal transduction histidine kinase